MQKSLASTTKPLWPSRLIEDAQNVYNNVTQAATRLLDPLLQPRHEAKEYQAFLHAKVELARASLRAKQGISNEEVEADFAARRASVVAKM
jgi:hypothetical protein